jgi:hypothetical protein
MARPKYMFLVALVALLLAACSGTAEPTAATAPTAEEREPTEVAATETSAPTEEPTELSPTATEAEATKETSEQATATEKPEDATDTPDTQPATDTPDAQPATATAPPAPDDPLAFLEVGPDDWIRGPADAPVTIIEYSDFQ